MPETWNRATDGPPPNDPTDGWGWGPGGRPHDRHWLPGTVLDGKPAPACWCAADTVATAPAGKDTPRRRPKAPEPVIQARSASEADTPELDDATATRLLLHYLRKLVK